MTKKAYNKLLEKFDSYTDKTKVKYLMIALDYMQQYNGRTVNDCIVMAMGGDYADEEQ